MSWWATPTARLLLEVLSALAPRCRATGGIHRLIPDPTKIPFLDREDLQIDYIESEFFPT